MKRGMVLFEGIFLGTILGLACIYPDSLISPLSVFFVLIRFWQILDAKQVCSKLFYFVGLGFHFTAMWWLMPTVSKFGGFPLWISFFILLLFSFSSSLQFLFVSLLFKYLRKYVGVFSAFIFSWMLFEFYFPRLFPWGLGHFFVAVKPLVAFSEIIGERGVSFLVLSLSYLVFSLRKCVSGSEFKRILAVCACAFFAIFYTGKILNDRVSELLKTAPEVSSLLVQGNLSTEVKGDVSFLSANLDTYRSLTTGALRENPDVNFVVWPETVFTTWTPFFKEGSYFEDKHDPFLGLNNNLIYGALTYEASKDVYGKEDIDYYNSAIFRSHYGDVRGVYAKRVLMPFGEYVPFVDLFPFLKSLVPIGDGFSVGPLDEPMDVDGLRIGVLICYEDLVSSLGRDYNKKGANVLLNITNDAWYGDSPASRQHDLLARFRALETRTYLLRSTNTGFTSLIDPFGNVVSSLEQFKEGVLRVDLRASNRVTVYSEYGDGVLMGMLVLLLTGSFLMNVKKKSRL